MSVASRSLRANRLWILVTALVILAPGAANAQLGTFLGPGSTVGGDYLRGQGVFLTGLGYFNYTTAIAASINTDTVIRWNQYVYESLQEDLRQKAIHRAYRKQRDEANYQARITQLRERPDQADLRSGDALNMVLFDLLDPRIGTSAQRSIHVPLPGDAIRKIPFNFASRAATFSMERLIGKREWPLALRGEAFAIYRRSYERAIDNAIELDVEGKLTGEAVAVVEQAVRDLENQVDRVIPQSQVQDYNNAKNFVKRIGEFPRLLRERSVERVIAEIETYPGTTVSDLIAFMQRHNLRFGVADSPLENALYANVFESLRAQREQVPLPPAPMGEAPNR